MQGFTGLIGLIILAICYFVVGGCVNIVGHIFK